MQAANDMPIFFEPLDKEEIKKILQQNDFYYGDDLTQIQIEVKYHSLFSNHTASSLTLQH